MTYLHDLASNALANVSLGPKAYPGNIAGSGADMLAGDGLLTLVIAVEKIVDGNCTITVNQSTDNSTWTALTALTAPGVIQNSTVANNTVLFGLYQRDSRYVQAVANTTGNTTGANFTCFFIEQKKFVAN